MNDIEKRIEEIFYSGCDLLSLDGYRKIPATVVRNDKEFLAKLLILYHQLLSEELETLRWCLMRPEGTLKSDTDILNAYIEEIDNRLATLNKEKD